MAGVQTRFPSPGTATPYGIQFLTQLPTSGMGGEYYVIVFLNDPTTIPNPYGGNTPLPKRPPVSIPPSNTTVTVPPSGTVTMPPPPTTPSSTTTTTSTSSSSSTTPSQPTTPSTTPPITNPPTGLPKANSIVLGWNQWFISFWGIRPYADLVRTCSGFNVNTDANGYPVADFDIVLTAGFQPSGTYKIVFIPNNRSTIAIVESSQGTISNPQVVDGKMTWDCVINSDFTDNWMIRLNNTGEGGIIKVIVPNHTENDLFNRNHLRQTADVGAGSSARKNVVRFMDWQNANDYPEDKCINFADRTKPTEAIQGNENNRGVCIEHLIQFSIDSGTNPRFNLPIQSSESYIKETVALIHQLMPADMQMTIAIGNEVWNGGMGANNRLQQKLGGFGETMKWQSDQTVKLANAIKEVAGSGSLGTRFLTPLEGQFVNAGVIEGNLEYIKSKYGDPKNYITSIDVAPYFNPSKVADERSLDSCFAGFNAQLDDPNEFKSHMDYYQVLADKYAVAIGCYEMGKDIYGHNNIDAKGVSLDPRMDTFYQRYVEFIWSYPAMGQVCQYTGGTTPFSDSNSAWGVHFDERKMLTAAKHTGCVKGRNTALIAHNNR